MSIEGSPRTIFLLTILITTFCVVTGLVTFSSAFQQLGSLAACPGATAQTFEDSSGGSVDPVGHQGPISTRVTQLTCTYSDGSEKVVGNDQLFLFGLLGSTGIGVILGAVLGTIASLRRR